jgi:hypothetical protein
MTMPHLMNCPHSAEGWCLECVAILGNEAIELRRSLAWAMRNMGSAPHLIRGQNDGYYAEWHSAMDTLQRIRDSVNSGRNSDE